jgi:hypothetical protein
VLFSGSFSVSGSVSGSVTDIFSGSDIGSGNVV